MIFNGVFEGEIFYNLIKYEGICVSRVFKLLCGVGFGIYAASCSSVKMPDLVDLPEFRDSGADVENLEFPDPMDAPAVPENLRSDQQWDQAAKAMIRIKENFDAPADADEVRTDQEIKQEIEALKSKVKEYKLDDPVE